MLLVTLTGCKERDESNSPISEPKFSASMNSLAKEAHAAAFNVKLLMGFCRAL